MLFLYSVFVLIIENKGRRDKDVKEKKIVVSKNFQPTI